MRCGIIKMHYQPSGPCRAPAVQDVGNRPEYFLAEASAVGFPSDVSQLIEMAPSILNNTVSVVFWAAIECVTFVEISSADMHRIYRSL
jgi:hypothetical protein